MGYFSGATMKLQRITLITILTAMASAAAMAQTPETPAPEKRTDPFAAPQGRFVDPKNASSTKESARAEAYYNFTMGHIYEQQYEATSRPEYATQAIEAYKKAYALDPKSPVIGERLAEMYWKAQRTHDAELEAQALLKRNPEDAQTRRLLGHIYLRSLGNAGEATGQSETANRAVEQFKEVVRLDPSDTESALWLARVYRLQNQHDKAEELLRGILK